MKRPVFFVLLLCFGFQFTSSQEWMTNLGIAQRLAQVQNKMVLMVWEESTQYQYPVYVYNQKGNKVLIYNLFEDEEISPLIWEHFVPVIVSEYAYEKWYNKLKGKRSLAYMNKFNDDSIKILDINGNILNVTSFTDEIQNISKIIQKYSLNTAFMQSELETYKNEKSFYSAYFLASKYLDMSLYLHRDARKEIVKLSDIYLKEAVGFVGDEKESDKDVLKQRCTLLEIQQSLYLKRPKRVIRRLKKMKEKDVLESNKPFVAFLYYTAYMSLKESEKAQAWKSDISSLNLKKAELLINLNS
ncbi:hypothetical protein [Winogradskyella sp.]